MRYNGTSSKVFLVSGMTDMRKSIDGLSLNVTEQLDMEPFNEAWFIFCNCGRDKLKILFWDTNGFWFYYSRLEKGTFKWPRPNSHGVIVISKPQLHWFLTGLPLENSKARQPLNGLEV
ncbi:IS66 family insertion sequence element accessory protein TnpB [Shewanella sp. C32]|uniref:IS66 family insertion sequence element accessory protein TnpB n=1 Tax=Shewanella electrica TaxID=515560 RepID=A0ABT2FGT4_9GAMM|nr:IS66 family insertion sequence element accessory protein TnpB [Shewanella electrica]MCH1923440.1 IS66 family insertion sequence element accessory protein TnpB [Shewanella electrica]MCS4555537.1 IS66 family insertion sequence element accessory protein TnpB [Shewanella electrica]